MVTWSHFWTHIAPFQGDAKFLAVSLSRRLPDLHFVSRLWTNCVPSFAGRAGFDTLQRRDVPSQHKIAENPWNPDTMSINLYVRFSLHDFWPHSFIPNGHIQLLKGSFDPKSHNWFRENHSETSRMLPVIPTGYSGGSTSKFTAVNIRSSSQQV